MNENLLKILESHQINSKSGYRIYFKESMLVMRSGKFVWEKEAHAKNALGSYWKDIKEVNI